MSAKIIIAVLFFFPPHSSIDLLKMMYSRYSGKWYSSFTFSQTTENYKNDSLVKTATWYEAIKYPDKFRIDFGEIKNGNAVIFTKDSTYNFRDGKPGRITANSDDLTFLLGGMYFYAFDSILSKLKQLGYDLAHFHKDRWKGHEAYVIGADDSTQKLNQLWIDKQNMFVVRFIKYTDGHKAEGILDHHLKFGGGWSETSCTFFSDGKLVQKETYHNCQANVKLDDKFFDPKFFGK